MTREKNFSYEITCKDLERGGFYKVNQENRAKGYKQSWFGTETAARKALKNEIKFNASCSSCEVVSWKLFDRNGIIEEG